MKLPVAFDAPSKKIVSSFGLKFSERVSLPVSTTEEEKVLVVVPLLVPRVFDLCCIIKITGGTISHSRQSKNSNYSAQNGFRSTFVNTSDIWRAVSMIFRIRVATKTITVYLSEAPSSIN